MPRGNGSAARLLAVPSSRAGGLREPAAPRDVAWLAAVPTALLTGALVVLAGPPLGEALLTPGDFPSFWPYLIESGSIFPEPTEHARFLLALLGPLLLVALTLAGVGRVPRGGAVRILVVASQTLLLAAALGCVVGQHVLDNVYDAAAQQTYFTWATLVVGALLALAVCAVLGVPALVARLARAVRETPGRRLGALLLALLFTVVWLLAAINTDGTIGRTNVALYVNVPFWLDETFGVLNGRAPLADFTPQYAQLWPYVGAATMAIFGSSFTVYALTMTGATGAVMLAVYALLRRVAGRSLVALALFVPFLATSFFTERGPLDVRWGPVNAFSMFPMRYGGPFLLAWLTIRHLDGARPRSRAPLFLLAWLVAVNNLEFGIPALGATLAAVLWTAGRPTWRIAGRLAAELALGLAGALAVVSALTLVVAGRLPDLDPGRLLVFSRLFGIYGLGNQPISPAFGLHLTLYATYVAAIGVATARALERRDERPLTGALMWCGVFGLGSAAYFAGRSHPDVLISLFSPWALTLVLLALVAVRSLLARGARLPTPAELAPLLGVGVALCSVAQTPLPWREIERLGRTTPMPAFKPLAQERFVAAHTRRGERIAILGPLGHRIAYDVGVVDTMPYTTLESMATRELFDAMLDDLRREGVTKVFLVYVQTTTSDHEDALRAAGFDQLRNGAGLAEFVRRGRR